MAGAMAYRMAFWKNDAQGNGPRNNGTIFPMIVAGFVYDDEPEDIADACYALAEDRPDKCVVVLMRSPGQQYQDLPDINDGGALAWFAGGALTDAHYAVCLRFFRRWKENGNIRINAVVCDFEPIDPSGTYAYFWWHLPTNAERAVFLSEMSAAPEVKRFLPKHLRDVSEARWLAAMQSPNASEVKLLGDWNVVDRKVLTAAQRAMVTRAYVEVFGGPTPPIHNYNDVNTETHWTDHFGWPISAGFDTMDGMSAASLYLNAVVANTSGTIYHGAGSNAGRCARFLVNLVNRNNSIIGPKSVWLTNSRFDGSGSNPAIPDTEFLKMDAWREIFLHYAASGGDELVIGYGPSIKTAELDEMEAMLAGTKRRLGFDPRRHKPFDLDAATITTNGYTTTLASLDFARVSY